MTIFETSDGMFFVRSGEGLVWFDTLEEALHTVGEGSRVGSCATHSSRLDPHTDIAD